MTQLVFRVVSGTPVWAFALLGYLIWQGVRSLKSRCLSVWRVLLVPAVFIAMGLSRLVIGPEAGAAPYLAWVTGAALVAPLALVTGPRLLSVDRAKGLVTRPGSPVSLIRNVSVFLVQYGVAVAGAMKLQAYAAVEIAGHLVSGAEAGYFAVWSLVFLKRYRNTLSN